MLNEFRCRSATNRAVGRYKIDSYFYRTFHNVNLLRVCTDALTFTKLMRKGIGPPSRGTWQALEAPHPNTLTSAPLLPTSTLPNLTASSSTYRKARTPRSYSVKSKTRHGPPKSMECKLLQVLTACMAGVQLVVSCD